MEEGWVGSCSLAHSYFATHEVPLHFVICTGFRRSLAQTFCPFPHSGTPADKMLGMMSDLLDGSIPSIQDILFVQSAVLESLDIYKPMDVAKQLMQAGNLDVSV